MRQILLLRPVEPGAFQNGFDDLFDCARDQCGIVVVNLMATGAVADELRIGRQQDEACRLVVLLDAQLAPELFGRARWRWIHSHRRQHDQWTLAERLAVLKSTEVHELQLVGKVILRRIVRLTLCRRLWFCQRRFRHGSPCRELAYTSPAFSDDAQTRAFVCSGGKNNSAHVAAVLRRIHPYQQSADGMSDEYIRTRNVGAGEQRMQLKHFLRHRPWQRSILAPTESRAVVGTGPHAPRQCFLHSCPGRRVGAAAGLENHDGPRSCRPDALQMQLVAADVDEHTWRRSRRPRNLTRRRDGHRREAKPNCALPVPTRHTSHVTRPGERQNRLSDLQGSVPPDVVAAASISRGPAAYPSGIFP